MASECVGKSVWPELLGVAGEVAKRTIEEENSLVTAQIVKEGSIITADFRCDRVRVWVDESTGIVTRVPRIGKSVWPELLGVAGEVAKRTIEEENPLVTAQIVTEGSSIILDVRCDRVWVWVDETGIVTRVPMIGKSVWPELLGVDGEVAKSTIEEENSLVTAQIVTEGTIVTQDFRCDRVWVWVDETGIVTRVPQIG
ncbi:Proteinase inhibitor [Cinnamomum micranthum f. kanehirae]|uniref:Proteinase inhibitor n=1 Tax=Cinnamomum micranthum f. kanehirae TaxID=337451 RepID=A0A3S3QNC6_9MAGN|nr:Proteinase inhibitor [Cinnamomum micranthum f. kanehirae]